MPVRFNQPSLKVRFYNILIPEPRRRYFAKIASETKFHLETDMHYLTEPGRSVPCQHEECIHCPMETRKITYVPAMVFVDTKTAFQPSILGITDTWHDLLKEDLRSWVFLLQRRGESKNSPIAWSRHERNRDDVPNFEGYDIIPSLFRAWGMKGMLPDVAAPAPGE